MAQAPPSSYAKAKRAIPQVAYFSVVVALLFVSVPLDFLWTVRPHSTAADIYIMAKEGFIQRQVALACLGIFGLASVVRKIGSTVRIRGSLGWLILFFFSWAAISAIWSDNMNLTLRRLGALILISLGALALAERFSLRSIIRFILFACGLTLLMSLGAEIFLRTFRPLDEAYRFAGLMHPNSQGQNCAVLLLALLVSVNLTKGKRPLYLIAAAFVIVFLIMTKSRTALGSALVGIALFYALTAKRKRLIMVSVAAVFCGLCLAYILFGDQMSALAQSSVSLGRADSDLYTLTGRTYVWSECIREVSKHPLIGYGYGGFWSPDRLYAFIESQGLASAHSGYLEVVLDLGLVGLLIYVLIFLMAVKTSVFHYMRSTAVEYAFASAVLLLFCASLLMMSALPLSQVPTFLSFVLLARLGFVAKTFRCHGNS